MLVSLTPAGKQTNSRLLCVFLRGGEQQGMPDACMTCEAEKTKPPFCVGEPDAPTPDMLIFGALLIACDLSAWVIQQGRR